MWHSASSTLLCCFMCRLCWVIAPDMPPHICRLWNHIVAPEQFHTPWVVWHMWCKISSLLRRILRTKSLVSWIILVLRWPGGSCGWGLGLGVGYLGRWMRAGLGLGAAVLLGTISAAVEPTQVVLLSVRTCQPSLEQHKTRDVTVHLAWGWVRWRIHVTGDNGVYKRENPAQL